jgi:hypothetical protein
MELTMCKQQGSLRSKQWALNRRRGLRVGSSRTLTFSGVDGGRFLMGDGQVINVSEDGIGIRGDRPVKAGMALALFIELPDSDDPLCVPQARVSWVKGRRFGVALGALTLEDQHRLRFCLADQQASTGSGPSLTDKS